MTTTIKQYQAWSDGCFKAFAEGDVEKQMGMWAENCTHTIIDAFGEHHVKKGRAAMRESAENWGTVKTIQVLKNEIFGVGDGEGIGNAEVRWTTSDGKDWACNFVYVITLNGKGQCAAYKEWNVVTSRDK